MDSTPSTSQLSSNLSQSNLEKLHQLRLAGINPYPYAFAVTHSPSEVINSFNPLLATGESIAVTGRVLSLRFSGKSLVFMDIASTAEQMRKGEKIQVMANKKSLDPDAWIVVNNISLGDWIGIQGQCILTRSGERTILASHLTILSKTVRPIPIPKVYSGKDGEIKDAYTIQDVDTLWRYPELDMLLRRKAEVLVARSYILNAVRHTLVNEYDCIELETPFLNAFFGGAEATPFTTYLRALSQNVFLAVSPEIELKRAIVGGLGTGGDLGKGVFSIARNFRNEGVDRTHNPEFTSMEVYIPFVDFEFMMEVTERIFSRACQVVHGNPYCFYNGYRMDFSNPWPRIKMTQLVSEKSGIDVENLSDDEIRAEIQVRGLHRLYNMDLGDTSSHLNLQGELVNLLKLSGIARFYPDYDSLDLETLRLIAFRHKLHKGIDLEQDWDFLVLDLFEVFCEPLLIEPCHVILHPAKSSVLCKDDRNGLLPNGHKLIERFESYVMGIELTNAYSELNDPLTQRLLVEEQAKARAQGKENAMPHNEPFLRAIEMGMPPCGGLGIGIDRLVMILTDSRTIRDVVAFPIVGGENQV